MWIEPVQGGFWFNSETLEWIKNPENYAGLTTSYYSMTSHGRPDVYSLKAAKRLITKKWKFPPGTTFIVNLPWVGYSFTLKP